RLGRRGQSRWRVRQRRARARVRQGDLDAGAAGRHAGSADSRSPAQVKTGLPRVELRKRLERAIAGGHPWLYRDALAGAPRLPDGAIVRVASRDGRALAIGFWDARSAIAVRVVGGGGRAGGPGGAARAAGGGAA